MVFHMASIDHLLEELRRGKIDVSEAKKKLLTLLYKDLFYAKVDISRRARRNFPEVIFGEGKTISEIRKIAETLIENGEDVLITRVGKDVYEALRDLGKVHFYEKAKIVTIRVRPEPEKLGKVAVVTGGTSDIPVAEEAAITAEFFGANVIRIYDVGVAGIHRLFSNLEKIRDSDVVIVCAGMDAALFSVVGGLVDAPVIAVPTSTGYGISLGGLSALMSALNSCTPGVVVVNINNGFGAGYFAALLIRKMYNKK